METAYDGAEGLKRFFEIPPDVLIADVIMPRMDGFEMVRRIRKTDDHTPVLFLTATWAEGEKVALIHNGVSDEMTVSSVSGGSATITGTITATITGTPANGDAVTIIYPSSAADGTTGNIKADLLYAQNGLLTGTGSISENYDARKGSGKLKVDGTATLDGSDRTYTCAKLSVSFEAGKYYQSTLKMREYVDLGIVVGGKKIKWATCNVGAANPQDYGDYFAWGETTTKTDYKSNWSNYFDTSDGGSTFTKYNKDGGKTVLDLEDDAASAWRVYFGSGSASSEYNYRSYGQSVRPVTE